MTRVIPRRNARAQLTVNSLITKDLGYCCEWKFFQLYHNSALIAARLGVELRAVSRHKAAAARSSCAGCPGCMKDLPRAL